MGIKPRDFRDFRDFKAKLIKAQNNRTDPLTANEIRKIRNEIAELKNQREVIGEYRGRNCSLVNDMEKRIRHLESYIENNRPVKIKGIAKDRIYREIKDIEAKLHDEMLTSREMNAKNPQSHVKAVHKQIRFLEKYEPLKKRLKYLYTLLEPEDERITNLERLRR